MHPLALRRGRDGKMHKSIGNEKHDKESVAWDCRQMIFLRQTSFRPIKHLSLKIKRIWTRSILKHQKKIQQETLTRFQDWNIYCHVEIYSYSAKILCYCFELHCTHSSSRQLLVRDRDRSPTLIWERIVCLPRTADSKYTVRDLWMYY